VIDANLNRTTMLWDAASRNIATINALSNRTSQVFDQANRRIALIDANAHRTSFQFDAASQNTVQQDALLNRTSFQFDGAGRRTRRIDGRNLITTYLFDNLSRLTGRLYNDGTRNTFAYDQVGGRVLMFDGTGRTTTIFDQLERPQAVIEPSLKRLTYGYSPIGQRVRLITPDTGYFTYTWDAASRILRLVNPVNEITSFTFDAANRETVDYLANTTRASMTYDLASQVTKVANISNTGTTLTSFAYLYDGVGNRQRVVEASLDRVSWSYDATYQLTHEARSGVNAYNVTHTWDPVGNRLVQNVNAARTTVTYNAGNEIIYSLNNDGRTSFTFDGAGNQTRTVSPALSRTTYLWDGENRLLKVSLPTAIINTMVYKADGLRAQKQDSTGTTNSVWDLRNVLLDGDASNVTQVLYTSNPRFYGTLLSQSRTGTSSFFQFDALGSAVALAGLSGSVSDTYFYKAFGESVDGTGSTINPFRFVGRFGYSLSADIAVYYARSRYYVPGIARWMALDPIYAARNPNRYAYAGNGPTRWSDASGLQPEGPFCAFVTSPGLSCLCFVIEVLDLISGLFPGLLTSISVILNILDCLCDFLAILQTECGVVGAIREGGCGRLATAGFGAVDSLLGIWLSCSLDLGQLLALLSKPAYSLAAIFNAVERVVLALIEGGGLTLSELGLEGTGAGSGFRSCLTLVGLNDPPVIDPPIGV
jgi:RHS repeat-associated protein